MHIQAGLDDRSESHLDFFAAHNIQETSVQRNTTAGWCGNNHLVTVNHYRRVVLPRVGKLPPFTEAALDPLNSPKKHNRFGPYVYIYGVVGEPKKINRLMVGARKANSTMRVKLGRI